MPQKDLQQEIVDGANTILQSVDFLEKLIDEKIYKLSSNPFITDDKIKEAEAEILSLIKKLRQEESEMDRFMAKYIGIIKNEKEKVLHDIKRKE